jgi:hypothetical protein
LYLRFGTLPAIGSLNRDITRHAQHPAHDRKTEQFGFGQPFRIHSQVRNHRYIRQRLMITDYDVYLARVKVFEAANVDSPRVDLGERAAEAAEPSPGSPPAWVTVSQPDDSQQGNPKQDQSRARSPNPQRAQDPDHLI